MTAEINDSKPVGNLSARTPLYVDSPNNIYYSKSQPAFNINSISDIQIHNNRDNTYQAISTVTTAYPNSNQVNPFYIRTTPTQNPGDIQTISFRITKDFEQGKTYIFCADDPAWNLNGKGDTNELIDDLDEPSNNYFVWTVPILTIPVILIKWNNYNFQNQELSFTTGDVSSSRYGTYDDVDDLLNKEDYNYPKNNPEDPFSGSVSDYKAISHGRMTPKFEIINASSNNNPISLDNYAHNINGRYIDYGETNDSTGSKLKPELLSAYKQAVINYENDNGIGSFDKLYGKHNVCFMHSGYGGKTWVENRGNYVWSHKWDFTDENDVKIKYFINPYKIKKGNNINIISIGVIVHESMHIFGLSDLYDTDFTSKGAGYLSVKGSGSWGTDTASPWLPSFATTYTRSKLNGFFTTNIIEINNTRVNLSLPSISISDKSYKLTIPGNNNEYWLLEYRTPIGFDRKLPDSGGIAIWHIVENINNNKNEYPPNKRGESGYKMSQEASDGLFN